MNYLRRFCIIIVAIIMLPVHVLMAQSLVKITGQVTDENGEPLEGVAVMTSDMKVGTLTDAKGRYSISVKEKTVLLFDYM